MKKKRLFDVLLSSASLIALSPVLVGIGMTIRIKEGGPIFYAQTRLGQNEKPFNIYKFRTMSGGNADETRPTFETKRVTPLGHVLRNTKLDELPQLWNVLKGDMSLVGYRPRVPEGPLSLSIQFDDRSLYYKMKPGMTGVEQNANLVGPDVPHEETVRLVHDYNGKAPTLLRDIKIMTGTISAIWQNRVLGEKRTQASSPSIMGDVEVLTFLLHPPL